LLYFVPIFKKSELGLEFRGQALQVSNGRQRSLLARDLDVDRVQSFGISTSINRATVFLTSIAPVAPPTIPANSSSPISNIPNHGLAQALTFTRTFCR